MARGQWQLHGQFYPSLQLATGTKVFPFFYCNLKHTTKFSTTSHSPSAEENGILFGGHCHCAAFQGFSVIIGNNIKINDADIIESGLAGWMASTKAIFSSLLGGAVQALWERYVDSPISLLFFPICIIFTFCQFPFPKIAFKSPLFPIPVQPAAVSVHHGLCQWYLVL